MQLAVAFHHALADETRWRIVELVRRRALCVCELADILGMPQSSVSSHLQVIRRAGLLESERCEKWVYYRIRRRLLPLLEALHRNLDLTPQSDRVLTRDAKRALKRLGQREKSCCPGPKALASRTPRPLSAAR
jgi:ArsR family transcriptional regulator, arsenate/arsenite/antimonite-responsive transcriptional repressor